MEGDVEISWSTSTTVTDSVMEFSALAMSIIRKSQAFSTRRIQIKRLLESSWKRYTWLILFWRPMIISACPSPFILPTSKGWKDSMGRSMAGENLSPSRLTTPLLFQSSMYRSFLISLLVNTLIVPLPFRSARAIPWVACLLGNKNWIRHGLGKFIS